MYLPQQKFSLSSILMFLHIRIFVKQINSMTFKAIYLNLKLFVSIISTYKNV